MVKLIQPLSAIINYLTTLKEQYNEFKEQGGTVNFDPDNPMAEGVGFSGTGKVKKKEAPKPILTGEKYSKLSEKDKSDYDKQKNMLEVARLISGEYERQVQFSLQQLRTRDAMAGMTVNERQIQEAINQQLDSTSKKIDDITKKREDAARSGANTQVLDEYDKQIAKVKEIGEQAAITAREIQESSIETQRTFSFGWDKAFKQYAEDSENYARLASDTFNSITGNMNSALDKFVETGKFSFGDFANSVIKDLIKIQLKAEAMKLFSKVGDMYSAGSEMEGGGMGGIMGGLSNVFGGFFADGGSPDTGKASIVGERGPELFVPRTAGTIIPNNQLANSMGGSSGPVFNGPYIANMSAIDTQSGLQFIAKNKMAVWTANQSASRSVPTSR
jgi:lambda family phage tail tape measure protein